MTLPVRTGVRSLAGHSGDVNGVAFSPDGNTLVSASDDNTLKLWDVDTGTEIRLFAGHAGGVWDVAFSPNGKTLASGNRDRTLKLWWAVRQPRLSESAESTGANKSTAPTDPGNNAVGSSNGSSP